MIRRTTDELPSCARTRAIDAAISAILAIGTVVLLLATTDIGFPRDEGFYFRYSADYQDWFVDVEQAVLGQQTGNNPLGKDTVSHVWAKNAEHPPLAKVLFGYSWRFLGEKQRPIQRFSYENDAITFQITNVRPSDGVNSGDLVSIYAPASLSDPTSIHSRKIADAQVLDFKNGQATAQITSDGFALADLQQRCRQGTTTTAVPSTMGGCIAIPENGGVLSESTAMRFPAMVLMSILVAAIYLFGVGWIGRMGAFFAALAFLFVPRHFFHAHMTAFDIPVTTFIFLTVGAFWHSLRSNRWAIACGALWGLAILTKHNALFLPVILGGWWLVGSRFVPGKTGKQLSLNLRRALVILSILAAIFAVVYGEVFGFVAVVAVFFIGTIALWRWVELPRIPRAFFAMPAIGIPMLVLLWPRLWYNGFENFRWYLAFHLKHDHYMQMYFDQVLAYPPFPVEFPFAMTVFTVPAMSSLLAAIGTAVLVLRTRRPVSVEPSAAPPRTHRWSIGWLLGLNALYPIIIIALPTTPIFGGIKHWLPAMPFIALLAGVGFTAAVEAITTQIRAHSQLARVAVATMIGIFCMASAAYGTLRAYHVGPAYYNEWIGGPAGAANAGMQRNFWGYATRLGLDYLNAHVPLNTTVYFHKSVRSDWDMYRKEGLLRSDIGHLADVFDFGVIESRIRQTSYAVYHHQQDHDDYELAIWRAYKTEYPVWQYSLDGVPILSIYKNPGR
ncbi:MAG: glycosyltransferase family 39 protein [Myxococcales bacterium]|nr:glycosyltransferase family 39 protein [Myxococcales bacterium]